MTDDLEIHSMFYSNESIYFNFEISFFYYVWLLSIQNSK